MDIRSQLDADTLAARHRQVRGHRSEALAIRLHRAISWLRGAEQMPPEHPDGRFIHLWIAFNAAYAGDVDFDENERSRVLRFIGRVVQADAGKQLHPLLFNQFPGPIRTLIGNRFVFEPFWRALREHDASDAWQRRFEASRQRAMAALLEGHTADVMAVVFDRLYVLRNQLVHGGATWNGNVNRQQVHDGCAILGALVPVMLDILIAAEGFDDDPVAYPVLPG